ncbi:MULTISPECIES: hypothetical protein [unclassified Clostridium]|uniref:hypothetical protein n=1 Tax=unclassified Clostridium TaxID=2614128 RepID=UPI0025C3EFB2|nr:MULTISPECIES: hypothetical protein [unclassified Clostridium]
MKSNYKNIIISLFKILCLIFFSKIILDSIQLGSLKLSIPSHIILVISLIVLALLAVKNKDWFLIILFILGILFVGISLFKLVNI